VGTELLGAQQRRATARAHFGQAAGDLSGGQRAGNGRVCGHRASLLLDGRSYPAPSTRLEVKAATVNDATLTIGEVAKLVGLKASAIRYYESIGVLPDPDIPVGLNVNPFGMAVLGGT
jgi:MerR family regulatory protein